jgi:hypothetical protein
VQAGGPVLFTPNSHSHERGKIFWERHGGIDRRLTDVHGYVVKPLIT